MRFRNLVASYLKSGVYSFSASANEVLHEQLVEKNGYLSDAEYVRLMSLGAMLPGPFHINLVIATGHWIAGTRGAIVAASCFILPGFLIAIAVISALQATPAAKLSPRFSNVAAGMLAAVAGLVISVTIKLMRKNLVTWIDKLFAVASFSLLSIVHMPFAMVILTMGISYLIVALFRLRGCR